MALTSSTTPSTSTSSSSSSSTARTLPNIIVTGTPGTGKTSHAALFVESSGFGFAHLNVGDVVKERGCHDGWDEEWQSYNVDDERLLDEIEADVEQGGRVIDWHSCEIFPERWIDLVIVIRCDHSKLWDRLEKRGYPLKKIQENNEAEIMQTVLEEARASYPEEIVVELRSEQPEDMESNIERMIQWVKNWRAERGLSEEPSPEEKR